MGLGEYGPRFGHPGRGPGFYLPKTEVLEDLFHDVLVLDEGDDAHLPVALGAGEGVHFPGSGPGQGPILWISLAQFLRYPLDDSSGGKMQGTNPSSFAFFR